MPRKHASRTAETDLPTLSSIVLPQPAASVHRLEIPQIPTTNVPTALRRSPRKQKAPLDDVPQLTASSLQRASPRKLQQTVREAPLKTAPQKKGNGRARSAFEGAPVLYQEGRSQMTAVPRLQIFEEEEEEEQQQSDDEDDSIQQLLAPMASLGMNRREVDDLLSDKENVPSRSAKTKSVHPTSAMSRITQAAKKQTQIRAQTSRPQRGAVQRSNPYISKEAHCEDLDTSSGSEGEEDETDLSGFIVDDDDEPSFHGSAIEISSDDSEDDRRAIRRQRKQTQQKEQDVNPRRRLVRGRRKQISDSEEDETDQLGLTNALDGMHLGERALEEEKDAARRKTLEVVDLTSSPAAKPSLSDVEQSDSEDELSDCRTTLADPFSGSNNALKLLPSNKAQPLLIPSKSGPLMASPKRAAKQPKETARPQTPPGTPPQSPTKLKSPTKLLSPSKRGAEATRSPHRQSIDAFWDAEVINGWHDTFSPKKVPTLSPRKNPLARFDLLATINDDFDSDLDSSQPTTNSSQDPFDDSSDSLPSPCDSPAKSRSPSKVSALKAEQNRIREEKKAKLAVKNKFDEEKHAMADDLLQALDEHITGSKITSMSASTGGIKIIWSKTLRSTAGRANWKRTVTKPSGSPIKGNPESRSIETQPGVLVQHFASIELAEKIIDRPERLVNTLAHEFCHLANFMVSNVRDNPHGESFKQWGRKVTRWLRSSAAASLSTYRPEWNLAEVTTKHSYVVETKYLWTCAGRPADKQKQTLAMKMLNIEAEDEEGCGAEYGRHSKSIDTEKQRCGRCKGYLVQIRPAPRAAPASPRKSPVKRGLRKEESQDSVDGLDDMLNIVELSD